MTTMHPASPPTLGDPAAPLQILVIHETLPRPDRSGTDMKLMHVLRELVLQGHAITYVARSGVDRERYSPALEKMGVRVYAHDAARLRYAGINDPVQWNFPGVLAGQRFALAILYQWFWTQISVPEHYLAAIREASPETRIAVLADDQNGLKEEYLAKTSGLLSDRLRAEDIQQREREIYRLADLVLSDSAVDAREIADTIPGLRTGALTVIADVHPPTRGFAQREGVLFLGDFANRLTAEGAEWLLQEIWPEVHRQLPGVNLYVAGNQSTSLGSNPAPAVQVLGRVEDLRALYEKCRVFAAPTRSCTGIQTKVLTALSHGLPAVTTSVTAKRLCLEDGQAALLADDARGMANQIVRLHQQPALWDSISSRAQHHVRAEFSPEKLRLQVRELTASVAAINPRRFDPHPVLSVLRVEKEFPEVITHPDPRTRLMLRTWGYLRLGEELLALGKPAEAREQFLHVFPYVGSEIPHDGCFARLLLNLEQCDELLAKPPRPYLGAARACLEQAETSGCAGRTRNSARRQAIPEISVIIPTFNRSAVLATCLGALARQSLARNRYEVIVIDDGSPDATPQLCRGLSPGFRMRYFRKKNGGAGAARNLGLSMARGKFVLLINDDTIASPTLLEEHLQAQGSSPARKFAVLGDFPYPPAAERKALTYFLRERPFLFPMVNMKKGFYQGMAYFITCNLSVDRQAVLAAGSFDTRFRVAEDTELGARLASRGYEVLFWPEARATHDHLSFRTDDLVRRARSYGPATLRLVQKYPSLLGDGTGPLGRLDAAWRARTLDFLHASRQDVEAAVRAARQLDDYDFATLLRRKNLHGEPLADSITSLLEKAVTQIHWFYLLEGILEELSPQDPALWGEAHPAATSIDKGRLPCQP